MKALAQVAVLVCLALSPVLASGCFSSTPVSAADHTVYFRIIENGHFGYIDESGMVVIPPSFNGAFMPFVEIDNSSLIPVRQDGKWGYCDAKGDIVLAPRWHSAAPFQEGIACVSTLRHGTEGWETRYGFINTRGEWVIKPEFAYASNFSEGLACVTPAANTFDTVRSRINPPVYINQKGEKILATTCRDARPFHDGLALTITENLLCGFIDTHGNQVIPPRFREASNFRDGLAIVKDEHGRKSFIDTRGEPAFDFACWELRPFSEGLAAARDGSWGFVDKSGDVVIPFVYLNAHPFTEGVAAVATNTDEGKPRYGFIDKNNEWVIPPIYIQASRFIHGLALVMTDQRPEQPYLGLGCNAPRSDENTIETWAYIDISGRVVWEGKGHMECTDLEYPHSHRP